MKRISLISVSIFVLTNLIYPQDIINETGAEGKFIVRDSEQQEALVIDDGDVSITGALKIEELEEGTQKDKVVVWSTEDKKFKALYNMIPKSTINASIMAADSWTEDGSGNIYRATGYVGIGTTTPQRILDINPSVSGSAQLMRESDSDLFAINLKSLANRGEILLYKNGAPTTKLTGFGDTYFNGGNVGIGTDAPSTKLQIYDSIDDAHIILQDINTGTGPDQGAWLGFGTGSDLFIWNAEDTNLKFGTNNATRMTIGNAGNVGIGTTTPSAGLHLDGGGFPNSFMYLSSNAGNDAGFRFYEWTTEKWHIFNNGTSQKLNIRNNAYQPIMIFDQVTGNIGIGTETPLTDLHVGGVDGLLVQGAYNSGTSSNLGAGTRLHFYPKKAAFRAGYVSGSQWDNDNIGGYSTAVGLNTKADGYGSTALGSYVSTNLMQGSFIFGDNSTTTTTNSSGSFQMTMRFHGGYRLFTSNDLSTGVSLGASGSSWSSISDSTKKENYQQSNGEYFLDSIAKLKLGSWNYIGQNSGIRHYGPMAQEIFHYFGKDEYGTVGNDSTLATADMDGIMMIALQALEKRTTEQAELIALLTKRIEELESD